MPSKIIPQEHRDAMIAAYLAGETAKKAAALFGYSAPTCLASLRHARILPRSHEEYSRKYSVDESFFDKIDSEEKAYWLGFLTADGTVGPNYITLSLQSGDKEHLSKFNASLQSNYPVISRKHPVSEKVYSLDLPLIFRDLSLKPIQTFVLIFAFLQRFMAALIYLKELYKFYIAKRRFSWIARGLVLVSLRKPK